MAGNENSISAIHGTKRDINTGFGNVGTGYMASADDDKNKAIDFSATGSGDPLGYRKSSLWTQC